MSTSTIKSEPLPITLYFSPDTPKYYSNMVSVRTAEHDSTIIFCDVDPDFHPSDGDEANKGTVFARSVTKVVISRTLLPSLIEALQKQLDSE